MIATDLALLCDNMHVWNIGLKPGDSSQHLIQLSGVFLYRGNRESFRLSQYIWFHKPADVLIRDCVRHSPLYLYCGLWCRLLMLFSLQVVCFLLILVWDADCVSLLPPWRKEREYSADRANRKSVCKSFCVKEYFQCYEKNKCHKSEHKQQVQRCNEQYRKCMKKCLEEFESMDFKHWAKKYVWRWTFLKHSITAIVATFPSSNSTTYNNTYNTTCTLTIHSCISISRQLIMQMRSYKWRVASET